VRVLVLGIGYRGQESRAAKNHDPGISGNRPRLRVMADQTPDRIPNLRGELVNFTEASEAPCLLGSENPPP
jgi:hypothetical protein